MDTKQIKTVFVLVGAAVGATVGMISWFMTGWLLAAITLTLVGTLAGFGLYMLSTSDFAHTPTPAQKRLRKSGRIGLIIGFILGALSAAKTGSSWLVSLLAGLMMAGSGSLVVYRMLGHRVTRQPQLRHTEVSIGHNYLGTRKLKRVLDNLSPKEHTLYYASSYSYRKLIVDVSFPMEVTTFLVWRAADFPGRPSLGELLSYRAPWPWLLAIALCPGWIWYRSQKRIWKFSAFLAFTPALLAMLFLWGLFHFPGWYFVVGTLNPNGPESAKLALAGCAAIWTGYQSTHYFLGYVTVTNLQLNLGSIGWGPLGEAVDPLYIGSIAQPAYSVSVLGKIVHWGKVKVEGKAQDDKQFRSIFVRHYKELKEALDEAKTGTKALQT